MITATLRRWMADWPPRGEFWIYFFAAIFFNFGFSVFFFLFNVYLLGFGFNERLLGFIGSAMAVGTLCGTLPAGIALERFGLRRTLVGSISLASLASVLRVLFVTPAVQIPLAVLTGIGLCAWGVCLSPAIASLTAGQHRPRAFSITFASGIGVAGLAALAAGNLPAALQRLRWADLSSSTAAKYTLLLAVLIALIALLPIARLSTGPVAPRARFVRPNTPFLRAFLPAMAIWSLVTGALPPFASIYFVHHLGVSLSAMGSIFSVSQFVQFAAVLLAPVIFRYFGVGSGIVLSQLATGSALFFLARAHTPAVASWVYWLYMAAQCLNEPGIYSLLMARVPASDRSGASSYVFFVAAVSQIVASTAVGSMIVRLGYSTALFTAGALAVLAALLFRRLSMNDESFNLVDAPVHPAFD